MVVISTKTTMKQIIKFLHKVFDSVEHRMLATEILAHYLLKVAKSYSYIETFSSHADTLHNWLSKVYEEDIKSSFEIQVRLALRRLNIRSAELAFDITKEPFYGKTRNLHIFNVDSSKHSYNGEFQYITCCLINKGKQIPLMALPVCHGEQIKLCIDLIKYVQSLKFRIKYVLFDRGFYSGELIDYLNSQEIKYLIFVPALKGILQEYKKTTISFAKFEHQMAYSKAKSKWKPRTIIVVCKSIFDFDWLFATNIMFDEPKEYILLYKRRWQIETNYRVEDEAKIKSKSCNYLIRYFYFMVSCLFHLLWIVNKNVAYYVQFKRYLDIIENKLLFQFLGVRWCK